MLLVQSKLRIEEKEFPRDPSSSPLLVWLSWEEFHSKKSNNKKKKRGQDPLLPVPTKWRKCPPGTQSTTLVGVAKEEDIPFFDPLVFRPDPYHSYKHFWVGGDWPDRLLEALWAYRTSICIATGPLLLSRWHGRHSSQWTRRFLPCAFCSTTIWLIIRSERLCSRNLTSSIRSMGEKKVTSGRARTSLSTSTQPRFGPILRIRGINKAFMRHHTFNRQGPARRSTGSFSKLSFYPRGNRPRCVGVSVLINSSPLILPGNGNKLW